MARSLGRVYLFVVVGVGVVGVWECRHLLGSDVGLNCNIIHRNNGAVHVLFGLTPTPKDTISLLKRRCCLLLIGLILARVGATLASLFVRCTCALRRHYPSHVITMMQVRRGYD